MFAPESRLRKFTTDAIVATVAVVALSEAVIQTDAIDKWVVPAVGAVLFPDGVIRTPVFDSNASPAS